MLQTSFFAAFLKRVFTYVVSSRVYAVVVKIIEFISATLGGTFIVRVLKHGCSFIKREGSIFYRIINKITGSVFSLAKKICKLSEGGFVRKCAKVFESSFLFKTENLLAIGLCVIFICPHELWNNAYGLMFAAVISVMYIFSVSCKKDTGKFGFKIWLPFVLFVLATVLSVIISSNISDSIRVLMFFVTSFALCMAVFAVASEKKSFDNICRFIYFAIILTGIVAIVQKIIGIEVDELLTDVELNGNMPGRAFSTLANPNNFAQFIIIFFPFCFAYAATRGDNKLKAVTIMALLIPFAALLFTYSRSGWLGFAVTVVTFAVLYNKKSLPVILLVGIILIPFLPASVLDRLMTIGNLEDTSSSYRIDIWSGTAAMMKNYWVTGVGLGPGAFAEIYPRYAVAFSKEAPHTHMLFLEVFTEMGILGILSFAALIVCLVVSSCKASYKVEKGSDKLYTIAAAASMMGILTIGFAEYVWFYPRVMVAFFVAIGLTMAAIKRANAKK